MEWENYVAESNRKFPVWIIVVLIIVLSLCLGTAGLIGMIIGSDTFQKSIDEMAAEMVEGIGPSDVFTAVPSILEDDSVEATAVEGATAVSPLVASAVKNTPAPIAPVTSDSDSDSVQAVIAPYTEFDITALPPIYNNDVEGMKHNLDDYIKVIPADVDVTNFIADALFYNPFAADENSWDIGYGFRRTEDGDGLWIIITSEGEWELVNRLGSESITIDSGVYNGRIHLNANEANRLTLIVRGKKGHLLLNDELVARLDLSARTHSGDVAAATAYYGGHEVAGAVTKVTTFRIWATDGGMHK